MALAGKIPGFHRHGNNWFSDASLPSDITLVLDDMKFHLHKFPLASRCGRIANFVEESQSTSDIIFKIREEFPGGADTFLTIVKFCYGGRVEFTPRNVVILYCAADFLNMTDYYGEDNLLPKAESFFHRHNLRNWKDCILALQSCEQVIARADNLQIISRCLNALSVMVFTDPSLFGWPMMMYGKMQSPEGSILWNGINTGTKIYSTESDWWFEDISRLSIELFERLIQTMKIKGIRPESLARAIMYYCKKYLPGLDRWQGRNGKSTKVGNFTLTHATVNQSVLLKTVVKLLPEKKDKSFCRFLVGLLRVALILGVNRTCQDTLEKKIGSQLELATLNDLLIPSYSDSDTLYNTDCVERMIHHFVRSKPSVTSISTPSSGRLKRVGKLVDNYIAEIASDLNLKVGKIRSLAEALPESSRTFHDGLYRALDIYFKMHPSLLEKERLQLCSIIDFQKLSLDACAHASQNVRLPLRVTLQVLFFEQMHLRTAIASCLNVPHAETANDEMATQIVRRDGYKTAVRENEGLKVDMARMRSKVGELGEELGKIQEGMKKVTKSNSYLNSPIAKRFGCKMLLCSSDVRSCLAECRWSRHTRSVGGADTKNRSSWSCSSSEMGCIL